MQKLTEEMKQNNWIYLVDYGTEDDHVRVEKNQLRVVADKEIERLITIAYSNGYEHGHHDTVEGAFSGNGRSEEHDEDASDWLDDAWDDGTFDRKLNIQTF